MGQLSALFYKNWLLYKRSCFGNVLEFAVPLFFLLFVILIRNIDQPQDIAQQSFLGNPRYDFTFRSDSTITAFLKTCDTGEKVGLAPSGNALVTRINTLLTNLGYTSLSFATEAAMEEHIRRQGYDTSDDRICFAVVVASSSGGNYDYKLRFNITNNPDDSDGPNSNQQLVLDQAVDLDLYRISTRKGMIGANTLVNTAILQEQTSSSSVFFQNQMAPVYQQQYISDPFYTNIGTQIGTICLLPLLLIYLRQISTMLSEKESKIRESMSIMGMSTGLYYFSWFMRYFLVYLFMHLIGSFIFVAQLEYVDIGSVFILFILFDIVLIVQNFFIQVFLTRAKIGVVFSLLFFVVQYILSFIATNSDNPTASVNAGISVIPHAAFVLAFQTLAYAQANQINPNFTTEINKYTLGTAVISFVANIIIYLILTWYLDQVVPNEWGAKKHPLFCCLEKESNFTVEQKNEHKRRYMETDHYKRTNEPQEENERNMEQSKKMIEIVGLRKEFGELTAVDDLNVNMYNNQIFSLLGHNGAGKTTTISMLTGLIEPTQGYIQVFGQTQLDKIRAMIGLCPQHDTVYEDLTVEEHFQLFGSFKGLSGDDLQAEVNKLIADVNLNQKRQEFSKNLSGGQKRRLSVGIAFAGRSKVIILDEPTSGMDTSARRYIWQLLKTYKQDRVILLTTHFMDEADYLGDKIGIMGEGKMICCGSSIYLKNQFGLGYNITFSKKGNDVLSAPIIETVRKYSPNSKVLSNVATDLSMQLPMQDISRFAELFDDLDSHREQLKYAQYGISITTLEEVFLRIGDDLQKKKQQQSPQFPIKVRPKTEKSDSVHELQTKRKVQENDHAEASIEPDPIPIDYDDIPREEGTCRQFGMHFSATFLKRLRVIRRDPKSFCFQLLLPIVIMIFGLLLMRISFITDLPERTIDLQLYLGEQSPVIVPLGADTTAFETSLSSTLTSKYGSEADVQVDSSGTSIATFNDPFMKDLKAANIALTGGVFYYKTTSSSGGNTFYRYQSLVNTRVPSSFFWQQTLASQTVLNNLLGRSLNITVTNYPLPRTFSQLQLNNTITGFFASFIFSLALAFKFASIISFIVKERNDRSKHQQLISGMKISSYWFANFVYDYLLYLFVACLSVGLIQLFDIQSMTQGNAFGATWMLFLFYGTAYMWFTYMMAFLFKDYGNAQAGFFFLTFVIGGMLPILTFLLRVLNQETNLPGRILAWVLRLYPSFAFGEGLLNLGSTNFYGIYENDNQNMSVYHEDIALGCIIYLFVFSILHCLLLFLIESLMNNQKFMRCCSSETDVEETHFIGEEDVLQEGDKAMKADPNEYEIVTKSLRKVYSVDSAKRHKIAVDNLSFTVKRGEVFGLLGINGAGKSTTFKILSGQITSTAGDSYFRGLKISDNVDKVRESLGYCPQFDALIENLTVREQLELYYDLKSLNPEFKERAIDNKIRELNLGDHEQKLSGSLSGGNKRKLSVAMAMIGNPKILFLDESSTGMDPKARRFMWKVISRVATEKENTTVILTTHSMEEAEALSSRLGIMVKGNFKCIGTPQHIKSKYGEGFEVEVKLNPLSKSFLEQEMRSRQISPVASIRKEQLDQFLAAFKADPQDKAEISEGGAANYIHNAFQSVGEIDAFTLAEFVVISQQHRVILTELSKIGGNINIIEKLQSFMRLQVPKTARMSQMFDFFEKSKEKLSIQQYTVKQATVEQIFNVFAATGDEASQFNG